MNAAGEKLNTSIEVLKKKEKESVAIFGQIGEVINVLSLFVSEKNEELMVHNKFVIEFVS